MEVRRRVVVVIHMAITIPKNRLISGISGAYCCQSIVQHPLFREYKKKHGPVGGLIRPGRFDL
jgi:hypothetical protein